MRYAVLKYGNEDDVAEMGARSSARFEKPPNTTTEMNAATFVFDLLPTTTSITVRNQGAVVDGPFAQTKEHLLGFCVINAATFAEAIAIAQSYLENGRGISACEIRAMSLSISGHG